MKNVRIIEQPDIPEPPEHFAQFIAAVNRVSSVDNEPSYAEQKRGFGSNVKPKKAK